jgi:NADH-quinone oxidoreductase subunit L
MPIRELDIIKWIVILPLLGAIVNGFFGKALTARFGNKPVSIVGCGVVLAAFAISLTVFAQLLGTPGRVFADRVYTWFDVGGLRPDVAFLVDSLSVVMILVVTGVGSLIHVYSTGYMSHDKGYYRYFAYLNLFTFAMLTLVLGDNLLLMFVGWEGVGLCSYLLIGFWFTDREKAVAGMKAFITNRIGDLGFIVGLFALWWCLGREGYHTINFYGLAQAIHALDGQTVFGISAATFIGLALFIGATGKSAQIPLYVWLPDAMAGPTPVSALIHAATMVTAGVYMIGRMGFLYEMTPVALGVVAVVGAVTALFAATIGVAQTDIKKVLAYSTVSQLGYMFLAMGVGAFSAGIFHLMTHAFFKACLFLGSGSVIHGMGGEQDMRKMGGLRKYMPTTYKTMLISTLAIAGIFPLAGFFSKDEILWKAWSSPLGSPLLWAIGAIAAGLTAFYMFRLIFMTFWGECRADEHTKHHIHESPRSMTMPLIILAVLAVVGGWIGIPPALFGGNQFHHFTAPVLHPAEAHGPTIRDWSVADIGGAGGATHVSDAGHGDASGEPHGEGTVATHGSEAAGHGDAPGHGAAAAGHDAEGHAHDPMEYVLMLVSLAIAATGIFFAYRFYVKDREAPARIRERIGGFAALVADKYRIDELYNATVIGPTLSLSRFLAAFDLLVIDGIVNLTGYLTRIVSTLNGWFDNMFVDGAVNGVGRLGAYLGARARSLQTGVIQYNVVGVFAGVLIMVLILVVLR